MVQQLIASLHDFKKDSAWEPSQPPLVPFTIKNQIHGVELAKLVSLGDERGDLIVLHTQDRNTALSIPHVCLVKTQPGSVRAWSYHAFQRDRIAFTDGSMRVVLFDIRPESPTYGKLNILDVGSAHKVQVVIPPMVAHGVQNTGNEACYFINMPSTTYDPSSPDKFRLPQNHPGIPYRFD